MKIYFLNKIPEKETILASADSIYYQKFFPSLCYSVSKLNDKNLHIHIINPKKQDIDLFLKLKNLFETKSNSFLTLSYEKTTIEDFKQNIKTYYACNRFLIINKLNLSKCLVVDIDSIFLKNFNYLNQDIGLFTRKEYENNFKLYIWAGVFYFSEKAKDFISYNYSILSTINKSGWWWFMDQFSLFMSYEKYKSTFNIFEFDNNFISYNNLQKPVIFSAKGLKKESTEYLKLIKNNSF